MDPVSAFVEFARYIGSFLCFQRLEATFSVGGVLFPVCSGCFGIYLGSLLGLVFFPFQQRWSRKLFSARYGLAMVLPMVFYWAVLNIQSSVGFWIVPGITSIYCATGVLLGLAISNAAYRLNCEVLPERLVRATCRFLWFPLFTVVIVILAVFLFYSVETALLFAASMIFILGLSGLIGSIGVWLIASVSVRLRRVW